ncbi:MAG: ABC transporter ATP-binding protein/permease [Eubacterium sp.]|nr:ABC transporter ATP-binding protein/permease [Eubacterium sp.]
MKLIFPLIKQYKNAFIASILLMIFSGLCETMIPLMTTHIIDDGISENDISGVLGWGAWLLLFAVGSLVFSLIGYVFTAKASTGLAANIREALFKKIQKFSFINLDKFGVSGLTVRQTTDVTNIQTATQTVLTQFFKTPIAVIYSLILTIRLNLKLSLILTAGVVIIGIFLSLIIIRSIKLYKRVYSDYDFMNEKVQENVTGIRVVKAFAGEERENKSFDRAAVRVRKGFVKAEKLLAFNNPIMMLALEFCFIGIAWIGAKYISVGDMSTGDLTGFFTYAFQIMSYMAMLVLSFAQMAPSFASINRLKEIMDENVTITDPRKPEKEMSDGSIDFDHVSFRYGEGEGGFVLDDINFHVNSGEMIGIVGATGSSKTSLIQLVARLYDVNTGRVSVGGKDVKDYDTKTLTDNIAVVLQKNVLFSGTILDNLRWGKEDATKEECIKACELACADTFIAEKEAGYDEIIEQGGANLSGGQRQRLCLARALIRSPRILILDDALSALDTATESTIRKSLREDMPEMTKLVITQRVGSVVDADKVLVLDKGKICGFDTHENLLKNCEVYQELCKVSGKEASE